MEMIASFIGFLSGFSAVVYGTLIASMRDPYQVGYLVIVASVALAKIRASHLFALIFIFAMLRAGYTYHRFNVAGFGNSPILPLIMLAQVVITVFIAAISRIISIKFRAR